MAISGDVKQNYTDLQRSTGERFSDMADRLTAPELLQNLDGAGRASNTELAEWLRKQSDDEDAIQAVRDPQAYARKQASDRDQAKAPQGRNQAPKQNS